MTIQILNCDITTLVSEAIVNAANSTLLGGGGVDGSIHRKGGKAILAECEKIRARQGGCKTGEAVITTAGNLPSTFVIHAVGPVWKGGTGNEAELLKNCYVNSLKLAVENGIKEISFPNISTGVYHYPKEAAAQVVLDSIKTLPLSLKSQIKTVNFVSIDKENFEIYNRLFGEFSKNTIDTLITTEYAGLRGDRHLWTAFKSLASTVEIPKTAGELSQILLEIFKAICGQYPVKGENISVPELDHGGMSGGMISSDIWMEQGFPAILAEFEKRK